MYVSYQSISLEKTHGLKVSCSLHCSVVVSYESDKRSAAATDVHFDDVATAALGARSPRHLARSYALAMTP
jgi:hypothetical protein